MSIRPFRSNQRSQAKSFRIFTSIALDEMNPEELNQLFIKAGQPRRNLDKLRKALKYSVLCVAALSFRDQKLLGFVRATGDGAFNITLWDLVVDPQLEDRDAVKRLLLKRVKQEVKKSGLQCAISIFAHPSDSALLQQARFAEDAAGITDMALRLDGDHQDYSDIQGNIDNPLQG
ncbi:MAG: hypothetical protein AAGC93_30925 [Cyanobacteria bacterium P01_F01_bin.53]